MAEVSICSSSSNRDLMPEEERVIIRDIVMAAEANTKQGDTFYLMTQRWWQHWLEYVNQDSTNIINDGSSTADHSELVSSTVLNRPSAIDNSDLIYVVASENSTDGIALYDTLVEGRDYVLLPQDVWIQLFSWYGGGPELPRKVIISGLSQSELAVEVYPLRLQLLVTPKGDKSTLRISKKETIGELHRRACEIFCLNMEQVCIWDYYGRQKHVLMNDMGKTLDDANIQMDQDILVEVLPDVASPAYHGCEGSARGSASVKKENVSDGLELSKSTLSIAGGLSARKGVSRSSSSELLQSQNLSSPATELDDTYRISGVSTRGASSGLTGLLNLGNTCFMNSAIQCLVHTPELARYFQEDYHQDINWQNPLGMVGELALAFGELLRKLWASGRTPVAPRPFKAKLARFAPQFSGYNQHDSQELLAFLLDGLHEDLNRVKHKPYIKSRDADGRPDEEVADEYWANHIARNDSIVVDVCQGQYKSTLVCPMCNKISVTFDPFMYLSLPLQSTTTRSMTINVFTCGGGVPPTSFTVTVSKHGRCRDLIQALGRACFLKSNEKLLLAEIRNHLIHRFLEDPLVSLSIIRDDDHLAAYKVPKLERSTIFLQLIHRREDKETSSSCKGMGWKPYGTPLVSPIPRDDAITRASIQSTVCTMLSSFLRSGDSEHPCDISSKEPCKNSSLSGTNLKNSVQHNLPLQLVDEDNVCIDLSMGEDKPISLSSFTGSMLVFIDWSEELMTTYDIHYLENLPEVCRYGPVSKKPRLEPLSLYSCLEAFLREEPLVREDMWYCPQCKERRQASKKLDLWRLPEVLVIHLKRFSYSRSMKHKLETFVNFPIHGFDLTKYVANKNNSQFQLYDLYALTNHYGGMGSGHYTAHIKLLDENRWYTFDDSHISSITEDDVKSAAAYVLFYRRVKNNGAGVTYGTQYGTGPKNLSAKN